MPKTFANLPSSFFLLSLLLLLMGCTSSPPNIDAAAATAPVVTAAVASPAAPTPSTPARAWPTEPVKAQGYLLRPEVVAYAQRVARERDLPYNAVAALLARAQRLPVAIRQMTPAKPGEPVRPRDWARYRNIFVEPVRINGGRAFMAEHAKALAQAQARFGVPANIIAAIIGVETLYGQNMGNHRVLDALVTLSFDYPDDTRADRIEMFQGQLADFIELHYQGKLDAHRALGSFAGAMGIPQFMPTSLKTWAVASDPEARSIDLEYNVNDAIFSVANFLVAHGWVPGLPVFAPVQLPPDPAALVDGGLRATLSWSQLQQAGATLAPGASLGRWAEYRLGVINLALPNLGTVQYRTATPNFFALTEYNRSYFYASAVADLAQALAD